VQTTAVSSSGPAVQREEGEEGEAPVEEELQGSFVQREAEEEPEEEPVG
jgi:hypothetical protein